MRSARARAPLQWPRGQPCPTSRALDGPDSFLASFASLVPSPGPGPDHVLCLYLCLGPVPGPSLSPSGCRLAATSMPCYEVAETETTNKTQFLFERNLMGHFSVFTEYSLLEVTLGVRTRLLYK